MAKRYSTPEQVGAEPESASDERSLKIIWSDDGRHTVIVRGIRRRHDLGRLLRAAERHAFSCQARGLPLDTMLGTQIPRTGEGIADDEPRESAKEPKHA